MNNQEIRDRLSAYHTGKKIKVDGHYEAAPPAPVPVPPAKPSKLDIKLASLPQPTYQKIVYPNGRVTWGFR